jgi:hypothetical protein
MRSTSAAPLAIEEDRHRNAALNFPGLAPKRAAPPRAQVPGAWCSIM